ncbi:hypothetical protein ASPFODRAFT_57911 [Aspergillus luchuensis CBS 106.47]|uniref:Uncharacterized protein n=1 Tax=Aspergillus luchuensis (strain CBS 106.47) TaxID=1137211 RepID=A0A1M3TQP7_ASPLC|nr:hypothetical protein ASPFODRAFT_57911 [Aspergillus luchuensis CBS 106.47]
MEHERYSRLFDVTCHKHLTSPDGLQLPKEACAAECVSRQYYRHRRRRLLETEGFRRRVLPWIDLAAAPRSMLRRQHIPIAIRSFLGAGGSRRPRTDLTTSVRLKRAAGSSGH